MPEYRAITNEQLCSFIKKDDFRSQTFQLSQTWKVWGVGYESNLNLQSVVGNFDKIRKLFGNSVVQAHLVGNMCEVSFFGL